MKQMYIAAAALLALVVFGVVLRPHQASAQGGQSQTSWLEGTILSQDRQVLRNTNNYKTGGPTVRVVTPDGATLETSSDPKMGGLYSLRNLQPGVYEVSVLDAYVGPAKFRPQRFHGVLVKPGVRTVLNITMQPGETLQEIGKPVVVAEPAIVISEELARLRREIAALRAGK